MLDRIIRLSCELPILFSTTSSGVVNTAAHYLFCRQARTVEHRGNNAASGMDRQA